jgi:hypothetical protein
MLNKRQFSMARLALWVAVAAVGFGWSRLVAGNRAEVLLMDAAILLAMVVGCGADALNTIALS